MSYKYCCFMGPPGVGKGTQALEIAKVKNLKHISTGSILRESMDKKHPIGLQTKEYMNKGALVPDDLMIDLVEDILSRSKKGFILDGFPRTLKQAEALDKILSDNGMSLDQVFVFQLDKESLVYRMTGRRMAPVSGRIYHTEYFPPKKQGFCDETGEKLEQREDDKEGVVRLRLDDYHKLHNPLIDYYKEKGLVQEIQADGNREDVTEKLMKLWT